MAPRSPWPPYVLHLASRPVQRLIEGILRRWGIARADIDDLRQDVLVQALSRPIEPPTDAGCERLVARIARDRAIDYRRHATVRAKNESVFSEESGHGSTSKEPEGALRLLELLGWFDGEAREISRQDLRILVSVADGSSPSDIARQLRLARRTVRRNLSVARATLRRAWARHLTVGRRSHRTRAPSRLPRSRRLKRASLARRTARAAKEPSS